MTMLYTGKRMTKDEICRQNEEVLYGPYFGKKSDQFLTLKGKKTTLTKWIKQAEEYYNSVSEAYKCPSNQRYYLGDYVYRWVVENARLDVETLKEMRKGLDGDDSADPFNCGRGN